MTGKMKVRRGLMTSCKPFKSYVAVIIIGNVKISEDRKEHKS